MRLAGSAVVLPLGRRLAGYEREGHDSRDSAAFNQGPIQGLAGTQTRLVGYAFGTESPDVTVFDAQTMQVLETRPIDATVRWLSNEQTFWDGRYIWTYDFPGNVVEAIAIDPRTTAIARRISTGGAGPSHSLMLRSDDRTAWVNIAGDNYLAVIDIEAGEVVDRVETGEFP